MSFPAFRRAVPAFESAVGLRIVGAGAHMSGSHQTDELFEIAGQELRPVVADDAGLFSRELLQRLLQDEFDLSFLHRLPQLPMHDKAAEAVQSGDQEMGFIGNLGGWRY